MGIKTVEAEQPHETYPTSLPPLQPAQCPLKRWEIFMPHPSDYLCNCMFDFTHRRDMDASQYVHVDVLSDVPGA